MLACRYCNLPDGRIDAKTHAAHVAAMQRQARKGEPRPMSAAARLAVNTTPKMSLARITRKPEYQEE